MIAAAGKPPILPIFVCYSPRDLLVTWNSDVIFVKNLLGPPLRPYKWSQLVTTAKTVHIPGQTTLEAGCDDGQNGPFSRSNEPRIRVCHGQNGPFSRSNEPRIRPRDLMATWNSGVIFTKNLHGPQLRPKLYKQLVTMAKTAYFHGQTIPRADCFATLVEIADELGDPPFGQLIAFSVLPLASSHSGSLGSTVLLRGTDWRLADCSFPRLLIHFLQGFAYYNEGRFMSFRDSPSCTRQSAGFHFLFFSALFALFCA
uniref:Uncharacterized protein n=1 Tax=Solanum tuberosum TaxID=4113 RepID=M1DQA9_SOLTU